MFINKIIVYSLVVIRLYIVYALRIKFFAFKVHRQGYNYHIPPVGFLSRMRCRFKHFALCLSVVTFALVILMRILHAPPLTPAERLQIRRDVDALNCSLLMAGSRTEQTKAYQIARRYRPSGYVVTDAEYERLAQNCSAFVRDYGYAQKKVSECHIQRAVRRRVCVSSEIVSKNEFSIKCYETVLYT